MEKINLISSFLCKMEDCFYQLNHTKHQYLYFVNLKGIVKLFLGVSEKLQLPFYCLFFCLSNRGWGHLYYPGSVANGQNVVLWTTDKSAEQMWYYDGSKLKSIRGNNLYALDKYSVTGNANDRNADVWEANDPQNQNLIFEGVTGYPDRVKIRLASTPLYLTARSNVNGTSGGKSPSSPGNVYWDTATTSKMQTWIFAKVAGKGTGTLSAGNRPTTLNYNSGCYFRFDAGQCTWHAFGRAFEVTGKIIEFKVSGGLNGKTWYKQAADHYDRVSYPVSNSIAVWENSEAAHVGYVEKVIGDSVYLTEANWDDNGQVNPIDGVVKVLSVEQMKKRGSLSLLGYIVL